MTDGRGNGHVPSPVYLPFLPDVSASNVGDLSAGFVSFQTVFDPAGQFDFSSTVVEENAEP